MQTDMHPFTVLVKDLWDLSERIVIMNAKLKNYKMLETINITSNL